MSDHAARLLVVDDVAQNVRLLQAVLEAHGYDVISATDGRTALERVASAKPDLVLLDVMMPGPDGYARTVWTARARANGLVPSSLTCSLGT